MKKKVLAVSVVIMLVCLAGSALAVSPLGKPTAGLKQGQWRAGADYAWGEADLEASWMGSSETLPDVESTKYLANVGYGTTDDWEAYVRLGVGNGEIEDFDGDYGFAFGFGTKYTFQKDNGVSWGILAQIDWTNTEDSFTEDLGETVERDDVEIDFYEIVVAVGPTVEMGGWRLYGGPFYYMLDGEIEDTFYEDGVLIGTETADIEEESCFGGYVGAEFDLSDTCLAYVESQFTGDSTGIAAGIGWLF